MRRFAYRLALKLGWVNVDAMLRSLSAHQFQEWVLYSEVEPFDEERDDIRFGSIRMTIMNANRDHKKRAKPFTMDDARMYFGDAAPKKQPMPWQEMKALSQAMTASSRKENKRAAKRR